MASDAASAHVLISDCIYNFFCLYLHHKLEYGTAVEKAVYEKFTVSDLVRRLLTKRCASYYGRKENYLLVSGESGQGPFSKVGQVGEQWPLTMDNCLTHDEIKLSALIFISSKLTKSYRQTNRRIVMIGVPTPTLDREGLFDYQDIVVTKKQNTHENGYGRTPRGVQPHCDTERKLKYRKLWDDLYRQTASEYRSVNIKFGRKNGEIYGQFWKNPETREIFDFYILSRRYSLMTMAILMEANHRAAADKKMAYIILDRNKLGFSDKYPLFEEIFLRNLSQELLCAFRYLNNTALVHLIAFTPIETLADGYRMSLQDGVFGNKHPNEAIDIKFSKHDDDIDVISIPEEYLVVETYRLDGNALPGNELWSRKVAQSYAHPSFLVGNTAIPQIHNPHVNTAMISEHNLKVYSLYDLLSSDQFFARLPGVARSEEELDELLRKD